MKLKTRIRKHIAAFTAACLAPLCCFLVVMPASAQVEHELSASDDVVFISTLEPVTINVLSNDSDALGHALTVTQVTQSSFGAVVIDDPATTVTYTPGENFPGEDTFIYEVSDGEGFSSFAEVVVVLGEPTPSRNTKGSYDGIIQGSDGSVGFIRITFATGDDSSRFTGVARFGGKKIRIRGRLTGGVAVVDLPGGDSVDMSLSIGPGFNTLAGEVVVGAISGDFTATQLTFTARTPTSKAGSYTLLADNDPSAFPAPQFPQGATWATVRISKAGLMRIRGRLGDGRVLSASAAVRETSESPSGEAALFVTPYARRSGSFSGVLTFRDNEDPGTPDFSGELQWRRPAAANSRGAYAGGFDLSVSLIGARFTGGSQGASILNWAETNQQGQLFTDDGNQANDVLKKLVTLTLANKLAVEDPGADRLKVTIAPNGLVRGSFVIDGQSTATRLTGVVLQKFGGVIEGQFRGRGATRESDQVGWFGVFPGRDNNPGPPTRAAL